MVDDNAVKLIVTREMPTIVCGVAHAKASIKLLKNNKLGMRTIPPPSPIKLPKKAVNKPIKIHMIKTNSKPFHLSNTLTLY